MGALERIDTWSMSRLEELSAKRSNTAELGLVSPILTLQTSALEIVSAGVLMAKVISKNGPEQ